MYKPIQYKVLPIRQAIQLQTRKKSFTMYVVRDSRMEYETILSIVLVGLFLCFSIDFQKRYSTEFHEAARNPFMRFLAGIFVVYVASVNPVLAVVALSIVFLWIADVQLLSTNVL